MKQPERTSSSGEGLKIIHAGLFRMGTKSLCEAYKTLGFRTHHALDSEINMRWDLLEKAAEAKWPETVGRTRQTQKEFTRDDWEELFGDYDAVTDASSFFSLDLAKAYPDSKVVVVQRDFDKWWESFESEVLAWRYFPGVELVNLAFKLGGNRAGDALDKIYRGFFRARNVEEIRKNSREAYDRYFEEVRTQIPPERRLEYKLGSGWEPLCEFLGKDVPDVPFPRVNDRKEHSAMANANARKAKMQFLAFVALPVMAVGIGYMIKSRPSMLGKLGFGR